MNNAKINNLIGRLWVTGKHNWHDVARIVNEQTGTGLSGNACRKRYQRLRKTGNLPEPTRLQTEPAPIAAVHSYQSDIPFSSTNVLIIGDLHEPFSHPDYFDFCVEQQERFKCETVVFIGDVVDEHALSFWDSDPDGYSAGHEASRAQKQLQKWYDEFPNAYVCIGNHDDRPMRKAFKTGIPKRYLRSFQEIWGSPPGWLWGLSFLSNGVTYEHGITAGIHAVYNRALKTRRNIVQGHTHIYPGVKWLAQNWFGMNVGCGIDESSYAMAYGKQYNGEVTLGCGVVLDKGTLPIFLSMK